MRHVRLVVVIVFAALMLIPVSSNQTQSYHQPMSTSPDNGGLGIAPSPLEVAGSAQDTATWWNTSFIYRRYLNITEPGIADRVMDPIHLYMTFEQGHCYRDSIRVLYYDNPGWRELPFQVWNVTYDASGNYILSARVSFVVNVSRDQTEYNYYIYYAKNDVGSVSYPDFYPFVYKSYTYSVLNLISYYDNNHYLIRMWDSTNKIWDDPRNVDSQWASSDGIIQSGVVTNVPYGTLGKYEVVRIEPNVGSYTNTAFLGIYAVYSNYPLAVTEGSGHKNSNPAVNDWYPGVDELGNGIGTRFLIGGVSGFDNYYEGKYWIQAQEDNTEVWVWTTSESLDTDWYFYNNTAVSSWPVKLSAGEYISKKKVNYQTVYMVNSTKPVATRAGDVDAAYSRDVMGYYPSVSGRLIGEEFYTVDMGHSGDRTRITNVGTTSVTVSVYRNTGSGWSLVTSQSIAAGSYYDVGPGTASDTDPEDVLHIVGSSGAKLMVMGVYKPTDVTDYGDWVGTINGYRFGTDYKLWGFSQMKFYIYAWQNAQVNVTGSNSGTLEIPAGGADFFLPLSSSPSLYTITSNATIGVVRVSRFSTSSPYGPNGDQGYGWMVPTYTPEQDEYGVSYVVSEERHLFELDITVVDLDGEPVAGATVTLYDNSTGQVWVDDQGLNRTGTTDANGLIIFEGLDNQTYDIHTSIDAASWLTTSYSHVWVNASPTHAITASVTPVTVTLSMANIYIHLSDLMGASMDDTPDEDVYMRLCKGTDASVYVHHAQTNATGWLVFPRVPVDSYNLYAKYVGSEGYNSYEFTTISRYANWSIDASEFSSGSVIHDNWELPLVTVTVRVLNWDGYGVSSAHVEMNNTADGINYVYILTEVTNDTGYVTFPRVLNGTWKLNVWKYDDFGQTIANNTAAAVIHDAQKAVDWTVQLRLSRLVVWVRSQSNNVEGASVAVFLHNQTLVATGQTNSSGLVTFQWIVGTMTSPYDVWYAVNVTKGDAVVSQNVTTCNGATIAKNEVDLPPPSYSALYTELYTTYSFQAVTWNDTFTFTFQYFNRTGSESNHN
ncbi:MAG: hypothetical protein DRO93_11730, partial [Candidatus Thorarchaeota archaeon]